MQYQQYCRFGSLLAMKPAKVKTLYMDENGFNVYGSHLYYELCWYVVVEIRCFLHLCLLGSPKQHDPSGAHQVPAAGVAVVRDLV